MKAGEEGSIVIEAMVAALIVAAMAGALFESLSAGALATHALAARQQAVLVAQSVLAGADAQGAVTPGTREGTDGSLVWRLAVTPYPAPDGASRAGTIERVTVTVRDAARGARPLARLDSLRFGR